jgi:hypothetical protein
MSWPQSPHFITETFAGSYFYLAASIQQGYFGLASKMALYDEAEFSGNINLG